MAAPRFINIIAGKLSQVVALVTSTGVSDADKIVATDAAGRLDGTLMPGGAPVNTSAGAGDAGKLPKLDSGGKIDSSMMPSGLGADSRTLTASENIAAGALINLWNDAGTVKVRNADATTAGKEAEGFCQSAIMSGASGTVTFDGSISGLTGLTRGDLYLSTTPGASTSTPPAAAGNVVQRVGFAPSTTEIIFERGTPTVLA